MITLLSPKTVVAADGKSCTVTMDIVDQPFNALLVTRVTHHHTNPDNPAHPRRIQSSSEAVFLESPKFKGAIPNETIAAIFAAIAPQSTFAPTVSQSKDGKITVASETPITMQWQVTDEVKPKPLISGEPRPNVIWTDILGATESVLPDDAIKPGQWKRLVVTNATGRFESRPVQRPLPPATPTATQ